MAIKRIKISNFKSFRELELSLDRFSLLIGANASGKSNFIQIFRFLRDIANHDMDNAISMQGGCDYLRNIGIGSSMDFSLEILFDTDFEFAVGSAEKEKRGIKIKVYEAIYKFSLKFSKKGLGYEITKDELIQRCRLVRLERQPVCRATGRKEETEQIGEGEIILSNVNGKVKPTLKLPEKLSTKEGEIFPLFLKDRSLPPGLLLFQTPFYLMPPIERIFSDISIYDFDPKLPKKSAPITGKAELEEDGSNLAIVLKNIIEDEDKKRKFSNFIKYLLPFVSDIDVERFADKSLLFKLQENYFKDQYLPAFLLSDGTINITAILIALYFEKNLSTIIIEEPERNIHPHLISKVVDMMKDASRNKQIIVTTHNPEIVKYADIENILLVSRGKEGFSTISKPCEKEEVKTFLENEMGIEELFVQNLLDS
ncbi:MAG: AAA family ATPase [Nitrospirota bacterium]